MAPKRRDYSIDFLCVLCEKCCSRQTERRRRAIERARGRRGRVDSEGVPSTQLSIVHEAQILHAPKLYLLHKTAIKSEMDAERCVLCACSVLLLLLLLQGKNICTGYQGNQLKAVHSIAQAGRGEGRGQREGARAAIEPRWR